MPVEEDNLAVLESAKADLDNSVPQRKARYDAEDAMRKAEREDDDRRHQEGIDAYEAKKKEITDQIAERDASAMPRTDPRVDDLHKRVTNLEEHQTAPSGDDQGNNDGGDEGKRGKKS